MTERPGRVQDKVAIVTGAGSTPGPGVGTGKAAAIDLAREGASVALFDVAPERAEETRELIESEGGTAIVVGGDATVAADCEALVNATVEAFGGVDILVNNIGRAAVGTVVDISEEDWDRSIAINLRTTFLASKYAIPAMVQRGGGAIVNVCSISAVRGDGTAAYSAAKGGMLALTTDMAYSHGRDGIRVNAVAPWYIRTPLADQVLKDEDYRAEVLARTPMGRVGEVAECARAIAFLALPAAAYITGACLPVDGGFSVYGF